MGLYLKLQTNNSLKNVWFIDPYELYTLSTLIRPKSDVNSIYIHVFFSLFIYVYNSHKHHYMYKNICEGTAS